MQRLSAHSFTIPLCWFLIHQSQFCNKTLHQNSWTSTSLNKQITAVQLNSPCSLVLTMDATSQILLLHHFTFLEPIQPSKFNFRLIIFLPRLRPPVLFLIASFPFFYEIGSASLHMESLWHITFGSTLSIFGRPRDDILVTGEDFSNHLNLFNSQFWP